MTVDLSKFPLPCFVKLRNGYQAYVFGKSPFNPEYIGTIGHNVGESWGENGRFDYVGECWGENGMFHYIECGQSKWDIIAEWKEPRSVEWVVYEHDGVLRVTDLRTAKIMSKSISILGRGVWKEGEQE